MGSQDLPDIYARTLGPVALGLGNIYQASPSCPCYNYVLHPPCTLGDNLVIHPCGFDPPRNIRITYINKLTGNNSQIKNGF